MRETFVLKDWSFYPEDRKPDKTITVEYVAVPHYHDGEKAYEAYVDGKLVGTMYATRESTDRVYGRIRVPGKGRPAWSWKGPNPGDGANLDGTRSNRPGDYERNRASAVARMLGYSYAERGKR